MTSRDLGSAAVLFGGSGFIGSHLTNHLLETSAVDKVVIVDIKPPTIRWTSDRVTYVDHDVRRPIDAALGSVRPSLIVNLAAVHREPGHEPYEYFETNLLGADHVCEYAEAAGCETIAFTSSIAVYGPTEDEKTEESIPVPTSPYGASKLVAERTHLAWQRADRQRRRLLIVRPGVVFGPGENGNVTRLVRAVTRGYFAYCGNHKVRKAGGYVKELCHAIGWALDKQRREQTETFTFNFTMDPTPTLDQFVAAIADVSGARRPLLSLPYTPVLVAAHVANALATAARIKQPFHPTRARKLIRSNNIAAVALRQHVYPRQFSLHTALRDWRQSAPSEWSR